MSALGVFLVMQSTEWAGVEIGPERCLGVAMCCQERCRLKFGEQTLLLWASVTVAVVALGERKSLPANQRCGDRRLISRSVSTRH